MFAELFGHHFNQFSTIFLSPRRNPHPLAFTPASLSVSSLPPLIYFLSPWSFLFWIFWINGIRQYSPFCVCLLSFEPLLSRLSHVKACISSLFPLRLINISLYGYAIFFVNSTVKVHLGCFHLLVIALSRQNTRNWQGAGGQGVVAHAFNPSTRRHRQMGIFEAI